MEEETLIIIKPDAMRKRIAGEILKRFETNGLDIREIRSTRLTKEFVKEFYAHLNNNLHPKMVESIHDFMTSHHVIVAILEGEKAVTRARSICGPTDPSKAPKGTIRGDLSDDSMDERNKKLEATENAVHSSESAEEAKNEIALMRRFLSNIERGINNLEAHQVVKKR